MKIKRKLKKFLKLKEWQNLKICLLIWNKLIIDDLASYSTEVDINVSKDNIIKSLQKVFGLKKIKKYSLGIVSIDNEEFSKLLKIELIGLLVKKKLQYIIFQSKFFSATYLKIRDESKYMKGNLEIKENKNSKQMKLIL